MHRGLLWAILPLSIAVWLNAAPLSAATTFASPAFEGAWYAFEEARPNSWGPLGAAIPGFREPYLDKMGNLRIVQYFDKGRMEIGDRATNAITSGRLTAEMKAGRIEAGTGITLQSAPAKIGIVGDIGADGPTYADLAQLPERVAETQAALPRYTFNGAFTIIPPTDPSPISIATASGPDVGYVRDPAGRYAQYVYRPFLAAINALPQPLAQTTGYPIAPFFYARVRIGGVPTDVIVQAFEKRVLTFNPRNPIGTEVEFANTGAHYYRWRYLNALPAPAPVAVP